MPPPPSAPRRPPPRQPPAAGETLHGVAGLSGLGGGPGPAGPRGRRAADPGGARRTTRPRSARPCEEALGAAGAGARGRARRRPRGARRRGRRSILDAQVAVARGRGAPGRRRERAIAVGPLGGRGLATGPSGRRRRLRGASTTRTCGPGRSTCWRWAGAWSTGSRGPESVGAGGARHPGGRRAGRRRGRRPSTRGRDPGIATAGGGPTSHASIIARTLGDARGGRASARACSGSATGVPLLLDGDAGRLVVDPGADRPGRARAEARRRTNGATCRGARAGRTSRRSRATAGTGRGGRQHRRARTTRRQAVARGADGVGLLRTEFLFLGRATAPDEEEQLRGLRRDRPRHSAAAASCCARSTPAPTSRSPYARLAAGGEPVPRRARRAAVAGPPELLRDPAAGRAAGAAERPLSVMFPMVSEVRRAARGAAACSTRPGPALGRDGLPGARPVEVGVMIEVPAAALMADHARRRGRLPVHRHQRPDAVHDGRRARQRRASRTCSDPLHPAVLRLVGARGDRRPARRPPGRGVRRGGGGPGRRARAGGPRGPRAERGGPALPLVKETVRGLEMGSARALADAALDLEDAAAVRRLVLAGRA